MADNAALLAVTSSASGLIISSYSHFLPPLTEVRKSDPNGSARADVYAGQIAAATVTIALGAIYAWLLRSAAPLIVSAFLATLIAVLYEWVLRMPGGDHAAT